ncbi:nucleotidyltransferase domain-containing protein [Neorhizobium sp. P12A]|jgi:predicted nucleotidyltransferase|uniref:nucleotidyltransferase domain-containing protein n=1 Tax=Rhizobium/Agrobacterium group TaxID=227290 RepID=UPI001051A321|nr:MULTISPECIES: nucleotidyltransferase domain-containing protein [Rhizobium/Agrobacterium group]KAA0701264.1 nucleotidyltransferase domain-containing protein [Neorhizobium sp. P12A]TCR91790.1 putative nucleotidyltransferase [Rhizobium sp. BK376]
MNRMNALTAKRRATRQELASAAVVRILHEASSKGIDVTLVGSLAKGDFRAHSDVDLLVRGSVDSKRRLLIERLVADGMRGPGIPYDLIFEDDLTEDRRQELLDGIV